MNRRVLITGGSGFIGTNLVASCIARGDRVVNLDVVRPRCTAHLGTWVAVDLLDRNRVRAAIADLVPTHVVHLAARTDLGGAGTDDYAVNTTGTEVLLGALEPERELERIVVASSMLVCRNGHLPGSDTDYCPTTAYGRSKQQAELIVRSWSAATAPWVIVRPTSIWGPWFAEPYRGFFEAVRHGRYVHPGRRRVPKALGYVGNVVAQIDALLDDPEGVLDQTTVYLCDTPGCTIGEWADTIAAAAGVGRIRTVPVPLLRMVARGGDLLARTGLIDDPPLTSFRLENMLTGSWFPTTGIDALTGPLPFSMEDGVRATLAWMDRDAIVDGDADVVDRTP